MVGIIYKSAMMQEKKHSNEGVNLKNNNLKINYSISNFVLLFSDDQPQQNPDRVHAWTDGQSVSNLQRLDHTAGSAQ